MDEDIAAKTTGFVVRDYVDGIDDNDDDESYKNVEEPASFSDSGFFAAADSGAVVDGKHDQDTAKYVVSEWREGGGKNIRESDTTATKPFAGGSRNPGNDNTDNDSLASPSVKAVDPTGKKGGDGSEANGYNGKRGRLSTDSAESGNASAANVEEGTNAGLTDEMLWARESNKTTLKGGSGNRHNSTSSLVHSGRDRDMGFFARMRTMLFGSRDPESDLNMEMIEELHMVTGFTPKELRATRSHFLALTKDANRITCEEFLAIPSVANNPLRERLLVCFGFDNVERLEFKEFVEILAIFNNPGSQRDQKLRMAFTLVDIDGDGQVSKNDLVRYLELITAAPEGVKLDLDAVAARVIEEGVSAQGGTSLSLVDYIKIMGAADFDDKLTIPL